MIAYLTFQTAPST